LFRKLLTENYLLPPFTNLEFKFLMKMQINMDLKKETMSEMFVKRGVTNDKLITFLRRKKIDGSKPNSIPQEKNVDLPSTKVNPPKENLHLMTHASFVKTMDIGKML